jgi:hypothetical protein
MHTTASCTLTPSMRDKSAYMLSKTHYTATISNTIRASRKRLSALNAEYASLEVQRTALMEQIQILENEKAAWVKTNRCPEPSARQEEVPTQPPPNPLLYGRLQGDSNRKGFWGLGSQAACAAGRRARDRILAGRALLPFEHVLDEWGHYPLRWQAPLHAGSRVPSAVQILPLRCRVASSPRRSQLCGVITKERIECFY